jgi:CRP/FNR family transcriptional regulator
MIMPIRQIAEKRTFSNKCKHCRLASLCLPANIEKNTLKKLSELKFNSRVLKPGEYLCRQGESSKSLFALRSGLLKSFTTKSDGQEYIMGFHGPSELFGWEGIDDKQKSLSIIALDHTNVCEIPLERLESLSNQIPGLHIQLMKLTSQRIRRDNLNLLRTSAEQRVASFLLQQSEQNTILGYPFYVCNLKMTHQDIANYLRIAPETISRTFRTLQKKGLLQAIRKKVILKDIDALKQVAEFDIDYAGPSNADLPQDSDATEKPAFNLMDEFDEEDIAFE